MSEKLTNVYSHARALELNYEVVTARSQTGQKSRRRSGEHGHFWPYLCEALSQVYWWLLPSLRDTDNRFVAVAEK